MKMPISRGFSDDCLEEALDVFLRRWGSIDWRTQVREVDVVPNALAANVFAGLVGIEADAFTMQRKLRLAGILRSSVLQSFNAVWVAEEADHSRILKEIELAFRGNNLPLDFAHDYRHRDRRSLFGSAALVGLKIVPRSIASVYMVQGVLTEYASTTIYRSLAKATDDSVVSSLLSAMAAQEGRHYKFYSDGARAVLEGHPKTQKFACWSIRNFWRPPGVDLVGFDKWCELFWPLFEDEYVRERLSHCDATLSELPGMSGMEPMGRLLSSVDHWIANARKVARIGHRVDLADLMCSVSHSPENC